MFLIGILRLLMCEVINTEHGSIRIAAQKVLDVRHSWESVHYAVPRLMQSLCQEFPFLDTFPSLQYLNYRADG